MAKKKNKDEMAVDQSRLGMNIPDDATMVTHIDMLPECFKQYNNFFLKKNMPRNPDGTLSIWFQDAPSEALSAALQIKDLKEKFESKYGRLFI